MAGVRNEAFYATTAQVLPTLLIALAVEAALLARTRYGIIQQRFLTMTADTRETDIQGAGTDDLETPADRCTDDYNPRVLAYGRQNIYTLLAINTAALGALIALGEGGAVTVLYVGTDGLLPMIAGPICLASIIAATVAVVWMPFARLLHSAELTE